MAPDPFDHSPQLSEDPSAELATLIAREMELHREGLGVMQRIRELHEQIAQRDQGAEGNTQPERPRSER